MHQHQNGSGQDMSRENQHIEMPSEPLVPTGGAFQYLQHKLRPAREGLLPVTFSNRSYPALYRTHGLPKTLQPLDLVKLKVFTMTLCLEIHKTYSRSVFINCDNIRREN